MIDSEIPDLACRLVGSALRFLAYRADTALLAQHLLVAGGVNTGGAPLALLEIVRVAQILGV